MAKAALHTCRCTACYDFKLPQDVQRLGHVAFRFKNTTSGTFVECEGQDVTEPCIEALPGEAGYALLYAGDDSGSAHYCRSCYRRCCLELRRGHVTVTQGEEVFS